MSTTQARPPPLSTDVPPTFHKGGLAGQLLDWMQSQGGKLEETTDAEAKESLEAWVQNLASTLIVLRLSLPSEAPWSALHEPVRYVELALKTLLLTIQRVPLLFNKEPLLAQATYVRVTALYLTLAVWTEADPAPEEGYPSPVELYDSAKAVISAICRTLNEAGNASVASVYRQAFRQSLLYVLNLIDDLLAQQDVVTYPTSVDWHLQPELREHKSMLELPTTVQLATSSEPPFILGCLVELCYMTLRRTSNQSLLTDLLRETGQRLHRVYDHLFLSCAAGGHARVTAIAKTCLALSEFATCTGHSDAMEPYWTRFLLYRLEIGPDRAWTNSDTDLSTSLRSSRMAPRDTPALYGIITALEAEEWGEDGKELRSLCEAYLVLFVPRLPEETLRNVSAIFATEAKMTLYPTFLGAITSRLQDLAATHLPQAITLSSSTSMSRRILVHTLVQAIIEPQPLSWMDDDSLLNADYVHRALGEVMNRFKKNEQNEPELRDPSIEGRLTLAKQLGGLPCVAFHGNESCSTKHNSSIPGVCFVTTFKLLFPSVLMISWARETRATRSSNGETSKAKDDPKLVRDPSSETSTKAAPLYVALFDILGKWLRHQTVEMEDQWFDDVMVTIGRGLEWEDERAVRLAAGRALVEFVNYIQRSSDRPEEFIPMIFPRFRRLFLHHNLRIKESTIITIGLIGKAFSVCALRESVCALVFQMNQLNPVLKGTAVLQLHALARYHKKSPYNLTAPYMDRIAPHLVRRLTSEREGILEFCGFVSMSLPGFLKMTLNHTLPHLFADGDLTALQAVAAALPDKPTVGLLIVEYSTRILSHTFMLQGIGHTSKTLQFILTIMKRDVNEQDADTVTIDSLVRSCLITLITEIVVFLGNEDPDVVEAAKQGLLKVSRMAHSNSRSRREPKELSVLLKDEMLGVISVLNDMLQDVRGKQTVESKRAILRSFGGFAMLVGKDISSVAPQASIMTSLQSMILRPELADATLVGWHSFLSTLGPADLCAHVGATSACFVAFWPTFSQQARDIAKRCLGLMIVERGQDLGEHVAEIADISSIPELDDVNRELVHLRRHWTPRNRLRSLLVRLESPNLTIAKQAAAELKSFLLSEDEEYIRSVTAGDAFDGVVSHLIRALYAAACRDEEGTGPLQDLVFECMGIVGAIDPDRFEMRVNDSRLVILSNYTDEAEAAHFVLHLIRDVLVGPYLSTRDIKYQSYLSFALQELLHFCKFTVALVKRGSQDSSIPLKVRNRWNKLPKVTAEACTPLLGTPLQLKYPVPVNVSYPIYPNHSTYRQWVQAWTSDLLFKVSGDIARSIFLVFTPIVRHRDVGIAHHLLPHIVLNVLAHGEEDAVQMIRTELVTVLEDQVNPNSTSTPDKKLLSAQTVFMLLDHLNKWLRGVRQAIARELEKKEADSKSGSGASKPPIVNDAEAVEPGIPDGEEQLVRVESIVASIDSSLKAQAAFECKAYARTLMNLEQLVMQHRGRESPPTELQGHYERIHEIYAQLDEPDGMEGLSTMILSPSLEHQIRQHESTGRWTSAQSCWEVQLQHEPDNVEYHLGLLRCLKNLGHYDSLRTHVRGVLTQHPDWGSQLVGYQVESEWMAGHWEEVQSVVAGTEARPPAVLMAQVLLAIRREDDNAIARSLAEARRALGVAISASGTNGYRRSYDAVLDLHLMHELDVISRVIKQLRPNSVTESQSRDPSFDKLLQRLALRFDSTLPAFRIREALLNMRRTAFHLNFDESHAFDIKDATGKLWLNSAKIARKAGHSQTAYSAILQARRSDTPFSFIESAKLVRARGEPLRALQELENSMRSSDSLESSQEPDTVVDLTEIQEKTRFKAKAHILHARWMADSERFEDSKVHKEFQTGADMWPRWESGQFHLGQFQDECYKLLTPDEKKNRGMRMNLQTVRAFTRAIRYGSKYIYQTLPRVLTIWLDIAEDPERAANEVFPKINHEISRAIKNAPIYKWYTAFPQIVSRIGLKNDQAYDILALLIQSVIQEYPKQALWPFTALAKSTTSARTRRSKAILQKLKQTNPRGEVARTISSMTRLTEQFLEFCRSTGEPTGTLSMKGRFNGLYKLFAKDEPVRDVILIPLQESLTADLPPVSASESTHQPFPVDAPTFVEFFDEVEVITSLAKPKKLSIIGSNGQIYTFLGKKDDLRKDGRLMDFDSILNKLLKSDSNARRRQLHIRTYSVVSLNEECGLIQWVPNTVAVRPVLMALYKRRDIPTWNTELKGLFERVKNKRNTREAADFFVVNILNRFPPVLHEWFIDMFPEPTYWLASRTAYSRTVAVMSMVGYILGLGDRHCENILLDTTCGDLLHVDFDCLFEKGQALETPEIVPFRLTHNIVDGLGVTGVEGVFRIVCEVTLRLLRENKDCLMNVLDAFVHDPLLEWEDKRRRLERANHVKADIRLVSQDALGPIEEKLRGVFRPLKTTPGPGKQLSVSNHVQSLIYQSTDILNLARMYVGWAPHQ